MRRFLVVVGEDVIDGDVDGVGLQPDLVAEGGDDALLDVACHLTHGVSVRYRHGKVHDGSAAQDAHGGMGMMMGEGVA